MTREEAIDLLAAASLRGLSAAGRVEQLEVMLLEDWSDTPGWNGPDPRVRVEFERGALTCSAADARYDAVLLIRLRSKFSGATNAFLQASLRSSGLPAAERAKPPPQPDSGAVNFLLYGISDPARVDLRPLQEPPEKCASRRLFELSANGDEISEQAASWASRVRASGPKV